MQVVQGEHWGLPPGKKLFPIVDLKKKKKHYKAGAGIAASFSLDLWQGKWYERHGGIVS